MWGFNNLGGKISSLKVCNTLFEIFLVLWNTNLQLKVEDFESQLNYLYLVQNTMWSDKCPLTIAVAYLLP